ncbi:MAG: galactokinase [Bacteroidota bacterium]
MLELFSHHFPESGTPLLLRAPGRVNLIGEHTDYNEGFVLPGAVNMGISFAIAANSLNKIRLVAVDLDASYECEVENVKIAPASHNWANYVLGVVAQIQEAGHKLGGFDMLFQGDIPHGAGLSSSAALECGAGMSLIRLFDLPIDRWPLVKMAQKAEHTYAGVRCGIMDQFASTFGKAESVVRLDCRSLEYAYFPLQMDGLRIVLCNTQVSHSLASSEYNTRREECEKGVEILQQIDPTIGSLRDASISQIDTVKAQMPDKVYDRCHYVVSENERVLEACNALEEGNLDRFGELMYASHNGLQHQYEVSCPELDFLVEETRSDDAVLGSRMMGGGFGGCTINLVRSEAVEAFSTKMKAAYQEAFETELPIYIASLVDGVDVLG